MRKITGLIIVVILSFFAFNPLLGRGFFPIHDKTQVARVYEMTKALKDGMFPVRWSKDLGYGFGYPVFNFYDPFPYYIGGFLGILGADPLLSTKLMVIAGVVISAISMFVLSSEFWGTLGAVLSAVLYTFATYHAVDIFVRGDFAEAFAFSLVPLVFYGLWKIHKDKKNRYVAIAAISFALVITSHNLTAFMISPFILLFIIYLLFNAKDLKRESVGLISAIILGFLISSFYVLPALSEIKYTNILGQVGGGADFRNHFVCPVQLWSSLWGYGGSAKGCVSGLSLMIGKIHVVLSSFLFLLSLFFLFSKKNLNKFKIEKDKLKIIILFYLGFLLSVFLTLQASRFIWESVSPMAFLQYPWRFLVLIVFFSSFISGSLIWFAEKLIDNKVFSYVICALVVITLIVVNVKYFKPQFIINKNYTDYINSYSLKWVASGISDEYMPINFDKPKNPAEAADFGGLSTQDLKVRDFNRTTQKIVLSLSVKKEGSYIFPLAYFPSWKAYLDGIKVGVSEAGKGVSVNLPKGEHTLIFSFESTPIEFFSDLISITAILLLLGYNLKKHD